MLVIAVVMFGLIWYMNHERTKSEATVMGLCWDSSGQAHYPEKWGVNAPCDSPRALRWTKAPKLVHWKMPSYFDSYADSHRRAMDFWNKELGHEHFRPTSDESLADITIVVGSFGDGSGAMSTSHREVDGKISATITVKAPSDVRRWMLEEQHELGHVLGLAHDQTGIMNPELDETDGMRVWLLHEKDRTALTDLLGSSQL